MDADVEQSPTCRPAERSSRPTVAAAQARDQFLVGQRARLEELLHQPLVGLGDHLDERLARRVDGGGHVGGHGALGELAAPVGLKDERLSRDEVDDAPERLLLADGQLNRNRPSGRRPRAATASERSRLARSRSSRLSTTMRGSPSSSAASQTFSVCTITPATASTTTSAASATCSAARASLRKLPMPGVSMRLILLLVPLGVGEAGRQRVLAGDLFFVEVGDGRAVVDLAEAVDHAGVGQNGRGELRLAGSGVADERDVSDAGGVVDLHSPRSPASRIRSQRYSRSLMACAQAAASIRPRHQREGE